MKKIKKDLTLKSNAALNPPDTIGVFHTLEYRATGAST